MMLKFPWVESPLVALAVVGPLLVVICRLRARETTTKTDGTVIARPLGIGVRVIQLVAVLALAPMVAVLGLQGTLSGETTGTLIGAIVGYALGGITAPVPKLPR